MTDETHTPFADQDDNVDDDAASDDAIAPERYDITSYGSDPEVDGIVKRLRAGDIFIPPFQRNYVWNLGEASRFVESLLLGLPVPGVFLAKEQESNRMLVIDGQQRLKSLQFFYDGVFNPRTEGKTQRVFKLAGVQARFRDRTYSTLEVDDRLKLDTSIIHTTVVKQDSPENDDTSIYHVFERLNNGGKKLTPQEIRSALYHGPLNDLLNRLNDNASWRRLFGLPSLRLKDRELILRFLALCFDSASYD